MEIINNNLILTKDCSDTGFCNMQKDLQMFEHAIKINKIIFRLYTWIKPTLSIGKFEKWQKTINGIDIVRRPTGGRSVLHTDDISYCLAIPTKFYPQDTTILGLTEAIHRIFLRIFFNLGIKAKICGKQKKGKGRHCFDSISYNEIAVNGKKIMGSAQYRTRFGSLQHGSILYSIPEDLYIKVYGSDYNRERFTCVKDLLNIKREEFIDKAFNIVKEVGVEDCCI
ncbi:MAG: hypothetical protein AB1765_00410 [Candidatus Hydrogenedentota bacterium]